MSTGQGFVQNRVESGVNGATVEVTPELLDQLATACGVSAEQREAIEQTLDVLGWSFAIVIDGLVNHRGRVHEENTAAPKPPAPEGPLVPYIAARMSLGVLVQPNAP